jgi:hypothetical protein
MSGRARKLIVDLVLIHCQQIVSVYSLKRIELIVDLMTYMDVRERVRVHVRV